jgi:hypothetical protein
LANFPTGVFGRIGRTALQIVVITFSKNVSWRKVTEKF